MTEMKVNVNHLKKAALEMQLAPLSVVFTSPGLVPLFVSSGTSTASSKSSDGSIVEVGFDVGVANLSDIVGAFDVGNLVGYPVIGDRDGESVCMHTPLTAL